MRNWEKLQKLMCLPNLIFLYNINKAAESIVIISLIVQRGLNIVNMKNIIFVKFLVLGHLANASKMGKTGKRQGLDYLGCTRGFLWAMLLSSYRGKEVAWCIKLNSSRMSCLFLFHIVINHLDKTEPSDSWVETGQFSIKSVTSVVGKYILTPPRTLYSSTSDIYLVVLSMQYFNKTLWEKWGKEILKRLKKKIEWNNQSSILDQLLPFSTCKSGPSLYLNQ